MALPAIRTLFDAVGPNPWVVRLAFAFKGVDIKPFPRRLKLDPEKRPENRADHELLRLNPAGTTPFMELEDGTVVAESLAMVQYIDALHGARPHLAGDPGCALDRARVSAAQQRVSLGILYPFQRQFQYGEGLPYFSQHVPWAEASQPAVPGMRMQVEHGMRWWDDRLSERAPGESIFLAGGPDISVADLQLWTTGTFMGNPKVNAARRTEPFDPFGVGGEPCLLDELPLLRRWADDVGAIVAALGDAGR